MAHDHVVPAEADGRKLHEHLREVLGGAQVRRLGDLLLGGDVLVDGVPGRIPQRLREGQVLSLTPNAQADLTARMIPVADLELDLPVDDPCFAVVVKPKGMQVHPMGRHRDRTLVGGLLWLAGARPDNLWTSWRPHLVNRLDRPTSGLVAVAKSGPMRAALQTQLEGGTMRRSYVAWVEGTITADAGVVRDPLGRDPAMDYRRAVLPVDDGGQEAVTHWQVLERTGTHTQVECELETGRTHQIRAHLASLGHPIVGDLLYGRGIAPEQDDRIALHAHRLRFEHPSTGDPIDVRSKAELPDVSW